MNYVAFDQTGLNVSRLCLGTGTHGWGHSSEQTALGVEGLADLLRLVEELAPQYPLRASQPMGAAAVDPAGRPPGDAP